MRHLTGVGSIERAREPGERRDTYRLLDDVRFESFGRADERFARLAGTLTAGVNAVGPGSPASRRAGAVQPPAPARTLVGVFAATVRAHPGAAALDDGRQVLSYRECVRRADAVSQRLRRAGIGPGDRVGLRMPSGQADLYLAVLAVLAVGAAYVPVDADDPDDRAEQVWREADVQGVPGSGARFVAGHHGLAGRNSRPPEPSDDAWVIFTSGFTGRPKGVAITRRTAKCGTPTGRPRPPWWPAPPGWTAGSRYGSDFRCAVGSSPCSVRPGCRCLPARSVNW